MGRNRKKKSQKNTTTELSKTEIEIRNASDSLLSELIHLLNFDDIPYYDESTINAAHIDNTSHHNDYNAIRISFIKALEIIAFHLQHSRIPLHKNDHTYDVGFNILQSENAASNLRSISSKFHSATKTKRHELVSSFQKIKTMAREINSKIAFMKTDEPNMNYSNNNLLVEKAVFIGRSILTQFLRQIDLDRNIINCSINSLSFIYESSVSSLLIYNDTISPSSHLHNTIASIDGNETIDEKYRMWAIAIQEKINIDKYHYKTAILQLEEIKKLLMANEMHHMNELQNDQSNDDQHPNTLISSSLPLNKECDNMDIVSIVGNKNVHAKTFSSKHSKPFYEIHTADTLFQAIKSFLLFNDYTADNTSSTSLFSSLLLVGPPGSGKTYICDQIYYNILSQQQQNNLSSSFASNCEVIYPKLPVDLMGKTVGASEEILISLFLEVFALSNTNTNTKSLSLTSSSSCPANKYIIILDGIQHILGGAFNNDDNITTTTNQNSSIPTMYQETLLQSRLRSTFAALIHLIKLQCNSNASFDNIQGRKFHLLLLCTSPSRGDPGISDRFDKIYTIGSPNDEQRRSIIISSLFPACNNLKDSFNRLIEQQQNDRMGFDNCEMLSRVVELTVGRSAAEISQCCRKAIVIAAKEDSERESNDGKDGGDHHKCVWEQRLSAMAQTLSNVAPESIRGGALDGVVDIDIYTSKELLSKINNDIVDDESNRSDCPLFGTQALYAWEQLKSLIITPLCQANQLDELLYGNHNVQKIRRGGKIICAGVLLSGPPGSGKSAIAQHCTSVASKLLPSVKLLDVSCTSLVHKEVGGTERAIGKLFDAAKAAAPCILLLDGIENIAMMRGNDHTTEGTMDRALSTLLTEMDGVDNGNDSLQKDGSCNRVAIIGITHDPNIIDPALRRPGRLEKCILLELPNSKARSEIFMKEARKLPLSFEDATFFEPKNIQELADYVAYQTSNRSAAEVKAVCSEAAMLCIRDVLEQNKSLDNDLKGDHPKIVHRHIVSAINMILMGSSR